MKHVRIPTIIGLGILLVGLAGAMLLVQQQQQLASRASQAAPPPRDVIVSNISDQRFSVSWMTDGAATGFVMLERNDGAQRILDDRDKRASSLSSSTTHYVTVENLTPLTTYRFSIGEGVDTLFDQQGHPYEVRTGAALPDPPSPDSAQGLVLTSSRNPAPGAVVFAEVPGGQLLSSLVTSSGNWIIPVSTAREQNFSSWLSYDRSATTYTLRVEGGVEGRADAVLTTAGDRPVPPIILGQSYDFRQGREPVGVASLTRPTIAIGAELPSPTPTTEPIDASDAFNLSSLGAVERPMIDVTLENPEEDGEVLWTTRPAFFGTGASGTTLEIIVESTDPVVGSTMVSQDGEWSFTSPRDLSPGDHQVTIQWLDAQDVLQSLTRSFVVNAQEGPAFTSTPSATPTTGLPTPTTVLTPTPTSIPTPTPTTVRTSVPPTDGGQPTPGSLTPSLVLLMIGGMIVLLGLVLVHRSVPYG